MTLLEECIELLEDYLILNNAEKRVVEEEFYSLIQLTSYGRVDWEKIKNKFSTSNVSEIKDTCDNSDYYIIWSDMEKPIIKCKLNKILQNIDDVTAVSFDTWLLSTSKKFLVEFYHESEITIGVLR